MITIIELPKLSQSHAALTAAYRGGFVLQEQGWTRYPAASWNKPAIVAMAGDQCVGVLNFSEDDDDLILSIDFAFADPQHPAALTMMLARFRSKYRGSRFESIRFTCHPGNEQMMKAVAVMGLSPVSSSYRVPIERLGHPRPQRPTPPSKQRIQTGAHLLPDWLLRRLKGRLQA